MKRLPLLCGLCCALLPAVVHGGAPKVAVKPWKDVFIVKSIKINDSDDKLRRLLVQRYNEIAGEMKSVITLKYEAQPHPWYDEALVDVSRRIFRTALEFDDPRERAGLLVNVLDQVKELEQKFALLEKLLPDTRTKVQLSRVRSLRLEVEYHLLKSEKK